MRLALALAVALAGCAPAPRPVPPAADAQLILKSHLGWPYRLERVLVVVDGAVAHDERRTDVLAAGLVSDGLGLTRGEHVVQLLVRARVGATCTVSLRTARTLDVGDAPMRIDVELFARSVTASFDDRMVAAIEVIPSAADCCAMAETRVDVQGDCHDEPPFDETSFAALHSGGSDR